MTEHSTLPAALAAAARGWHVFPLQPGGKRPALHGVDRCPGTGPCASGHAGWEQRATTDPDRIARAWTAAPFNVGIATGPSGLVVIDLDKPKPGQATPPPEWALPGVVNGEDVFAVVCDRAGHPMPCDTYTVTTGRGGRHLYYRHPDGGPELRNTGGTLGWLIDTRAHGGYVLAAGSVVNGRKYTTDDPDHALELAPLPAWLFQQLAPAAPPVSRALAPVVVPAGRRSAYLTAVLSREADHVTRAACGQRNQALFIAAQNLGQLVAGGALPADVATKLLEQAAAVHIGVNGFTTTEAEKTIASGLRAGARRPRTVAA